MKLNGLPYKYIGKVDTGPLKWFLNILPEDTWFKFRHPNSEHQLNANVQSIVLRGAVIGNSSEYVDYVEAWNLLGHVVKPLLNLVPKYDRVRIARLNAGLGVPIHVDASPVYKKMHRVHFPIQTNSYVFFELDDQLFHMPEGEVYEIDNIRPHGVMNYGDTDRIHFIVDYFD